MRIGNFPLLDDIKKEYRELRLSGKGRQEAVEEMKKSYRNELTLGQDDDGLLFWVGLADAQYAGKELETEVAEQGRIALEKLETLYELTLRDVQLRKTRYSEAPMPERKVRQGTKYHCSWKEGDAFAVPLRGKEAEEQSIAGCYAILRMVGVSEWEGRMLPIVTVSLWQKSKLPETEDEICSLPLMRIKKCGFPGTFTGRFQYCVLIFMSRERQMLDQGLRYLGNFRSVESPDDAAFTDDSLSISWVFPKQFSAEIANLWDAQKYYSKLISQSKLLIKKDAWTWHVLDAKTGELLEVIHRKDVTQEEYEFQNGDIGPQVWARVFPE